MFTLIHIDSETNGILGYDHVHAESKSEAIALRPADWKRSETKAYKGLLSYSF